MTTRIRVVLMCVLIALGLSACVSFEQSINIAGDSVVNLVNDIISAVENSEVVAEHHDEPGKRSSSERAGTQQSVTNHDQWSTQNIDLARELSFLSSLEKDIILEINMLRTDPAKYADEFLVPRRQYYDGNLYKAPGKITLRTDEGIHALDECISVIKRQLPTEPMMPSLGLSQAAHDHVSDTGPTGSVGHAGTDGSSSSSRASRYGKWRTSMGENISYGQSTAREIVIQLIVDDGVPSRGHRKNLLNSTFRLVGVSVGSHSKYGSMCVMDFAAEYEDRQ